MLIRVTELRHVYNASGMARIEEFETLVNPRNIIAVYTTDSFEGRANSNITLIDGTSLPTVETPDEIAELCGISGL